MQRTDGLRAKATRWLYSRGYPRVSRVRGDRFLFNSFNGALSDSPKAIFEALDRRSDIDPIWISRPGSTEPAPTSYREVAMNSRQYFKALGSSRFLIANTQMPNNLPDRPRLTYLQTWHGTPLKKIGHDNPQWPPGMMDKFLGRDARRWDYLVSPNPYSTEIFRRAFRYDGPMLETGYPRNDVLVDGRAEHVRLATRARLGLDETHTVVLFAPTWRDNMTDEQGRLRFDNTLDVDALTAQLPTPTTFLMRLHYTLDPSAGNFPASAINVSRYPDIADLYCAADVLLTDYSSSMFDFALTGKPMVFFIPDIDEYAGRTRGFYFDFAAQAPGPLCRTTDEVLDALAATDSASARYADSYAAWLAAYCPWDDGGAADRVLDALLGGMGT